MIIRIEINYKVDNQSSYHLLLLLFFLYI